MSVVCTAEAGRYTLTIEDTTGTASTLGTVQMQGIAPSYGRQSRGRGMGILPSSWQILVRDTPRNDLRNLFQGDFTRDNYPVTIEGPPGPNGMRLKWRGWAKKQQQTTPISQQTHPQVLTLTLYDGLSDMKRTTAQRPISLQNGIEQPLDAANADLDIFVGFQCKHFAGTSGGFDENNLSSIDYAPRVASKFGSWWDVIEDIAKRYQCRVYQALYDRGGNDLPRWHVMFRGALGLQVDGFSGDSLPAGSAETLGSQTIRINEQGGELATQGGSGEESAVLYGASESLPEEKADDSEPIAVNGSDALRDGQFQYTPGGTEPLYGERIQNADVSVTAGRVELTEVSGQDGFWWSERFYIGDRVPIWVELSYDSVVTSGSFITTELHSLDDSLQTLKSVTGSNGNDQTVVLEVESPSTVQVQVTSDGGEFGDATLKVYGTNRGTSSSPSFSDDDIAETLEYYPPADGLLNQEVSPKPDMNLDVAVTSPPGLPGASELENQTNGQSFKRATEYEVRQRRLLQPLGTKTIRTTLKDRVIGPRTRVIVERKDGTEDHYIIGSGRTMNLKNEYTELADITVPDWS